MSAGTSEFFCLICFLVCSCIALTNIRAKLGQEVILPCKAPNININNALVEWIRPELEPHFVLRYRKRTLDSDNQLPSYQNRVDLQDKEMKDGNVSLILKNVTLFDYGKYKCRVHEEGKKDSINIIHLEVPPSVKDHQDQISETRRNVGLAVGLPLFILLFLAVVLYFYTRNQNRKMKTSVNEMQQHLQQLDEMKLYTNSDPTGSNEKNQQEELEKQKWMKTVVKLKTELQNMNQELKPIETVIKEKICGCCPSKCCKKVSTGNDGYGFSECSTSPP